LTHNFLRADVATIQFLVGAAVRPKRRALKRDSGEMSTLAGIREDLGPHYNVGIRRRRTSFDCERGTRQEDDDNKNAGFLMTPLPGIYFILSSAKEDHNCPGGQPCPNGNGWFLNEVCLTVSLRRAVSAQPF
jgi:hypothetical protein